MSVVGLSLKVHPFFSLYRLRRLMNGKIPVDNVILFTKLHRETMWLHHLCADDPPLLSHLMSLLPMIQTEIEVSSRETMALNGAYSLTVAKRDSTSPLFH